jgi:phosphate/sulfate permease
MKEEDRQTYVLIAFFLVLMPLLAMAIAYGLAALIDGVFY